MQAIALQLGQQSMAPTYGGPEFLDRLYGGDASARSATQRRVAWTRECRGLFGTWTKETLSVEIQERHWLDRHENTNDSRHGDETTRWLR